MEDNNLNDEKDDESVEEVQVEDNEVSLADGNVQGDGENIYDKYFDSSSKSEEESKEEVVHRPVGRNADALRNGKRRRMPRQYV